MAKLSTSVHGMDITEQVPRAVNVEISAFVESTAF